MLCKKSSNILDNLLMSPQLLPSLRITKVLPLIKTTLKKSNRQLMLNLRLNMLKLSEIERLKLLKMKPNRKRKVFSNRSIKPLCQLKVFRRTTRSIFQQHKENKVLQIKVRPITDILHQFLLFKSLTSFLQHLLLKFNLKRFHRPRNLRKENNIQQLLMDHKPQRLTLRVDIYIGDRPCSSKSKSQAKFTDLP